MILKTSRSRAGKHEPRSAELRRPFARLADAGQRDGGYSKQSFEDGAAHVEKLLGAKSSTSPWRRRRISSRLLREGGRPGGPFRRALRNSMGLHVQQVLGPLARRAAGRMQGKAEEDQTAHAWQRRQRLRLRGHASAERRPPATSGSFGSSRAASATAARTVACATAGGSGALSLFHVGKLVAERRNAPLGQPCRRSPPCRVRHSRARPMREHEADPRTRGGVRRSAETLAVHDRRRSEAGSASSSAS